MKRKVLTTALIAMALLLFASCEDMFQPKPRKPGENDSLDNLFRSVDAITKLDTPDQFYIAPYYSSNEIRLTWSEVPGAAYYMVERAVVEPLGGTWEEPHEGDYEPLDRFVYPTSYTDQILRSSSLDSPEYNNRYYYRVSAFNTEKKFDESDPTEPLFGMLFRAPAGVRASGGTETDFVEVYWDEAPGAVSYEVLRSSLSNGASYSSLGTVQNVLYNGKIRYKNNVSPAEQGVDFYYMVRAVNSAGNSSLITRPAYGYARMFGAPDAPKNVKLAVNSGRGHSLTEIKIEWDPVAEGDAYYAVYRYSERDSSLTRLTDKTESTSLTDDKHGLKPGIFYYYKVQAILDDVSNGKQLKSQFSSNDPEGYVLSCPDELIAEKSGSNIVIKWKPAKSSEAERSLFTYNVYADSSLNGGFNAIAMAGVPTYVEADGYISTEVSSYTYGGQFFKVRSIKGGLLSDLSGAVSPSPAAAVILDASQRAFISVNEDANANGVYAVKVTWKKPDDDEPAFYHVQRSTSSETGYSRITTAPLSALGTGGTKDEFSYDSGTGVYTYLDRNESARVGRKYYYRVLSLNQLEQGSFPSGWKIGWGALTQLQFFREFNKVINVSHKKLTYMNKAGSTDKIGNETKYGTISGSVYYDAKIQGIGARVILRYTNYADLYIEDDPAKGVYFILNGESNSSASGMSAITDLTAQCDGVITCSGMYAGTVNYDNVQVKGGAPGGGTYDTTPEGFPMERISYKEYKPN